MNDFDYEVYQKKITARSAAHRVCGAKSKKCSLPSDHLTQKELRALSGDVKSYNPHQAQTWESFKALPDDLAAAHIKYLVETFGVTRVAIADAMGVNPVTLGKHLKVRSIHPAWPGKHKYIPTPEWQAFIGAETPTDTADGDPAPVEPEKPKTPPAVQFRGGVLELSGPKGALLERLYDVLPDRVTVRVEFTAEAAND